jgi:hypothetical protein
MLIETLKPETLQQGLLKLEESIDLKKVFFLVYDVPYTHQ